MEEDGLSEEQIQDKPEISLHAIVGFRDPKTMRIRGHLSYQPVTVLIDSGSTHNFINEQLAMKVGLHPNSVGNLEVMVAFGERLSSLGCDVVLRAQCIDKVVSDQEIHKLMQMKGILLKLVPVDKNNNVQ
ncbi:hypothetical protein Pint_32852 [Pistacia integerrima]|uniref:Uncharacterized protein n=1 Tax=Pistacia integerrima TaxID=434235 RepID=A0ACC0X2B2_9ROSI|nr:hypothetical protein Pint_32852 [Pistacia integerrima]